MVWSRGAGEPSPELKPSAASRRQRACKLISAESNQHKRTVPHGAKILAFTATCRTLAATNSIAVDSSESSLCPALPTFTLRKCCMKHEWLVW